MKCAYLLLALEGAYGSPPYFLTSRGYNIPSAVHHHTAACWVLYACRAACDTFREYQRLFELEENGFEIAAQTEQEADARFQVCLTP